MNMKAFALRVLIALVWVHNSDDGEVANTQAAAVAGGVRDHHHDWPKKILVGLCAASAIDMAFLSAQTHSQLPACFCFLGLTIIISFTCFIINYFVPFNYQRAAHVLQQSGIFFAVTAIFIAIAIPFPWLWYRCVIGFIYVFCWLTILLFKLLPSWLPK